MATEAKEEVQGAIAEGVVVQGAAAQLADQLSQALNQQTESMRRAFDEITTSISKMANISEDFAKKQDTNVDEAMAGANSVLAGDQVHLSRLVNNNVANSANVAQVRSQVAFDHLVAISNMGFANTTFALGICQTAASLEVHQQSSKNWSSRCEASGDEAGK